MQPNPRLVQEHIAVLMLSRRTARNSGKVANLTFVTSSMIASTLLTSGVENCNVVAGSPIEVSGTGALTGIMMAYEKARGKNFSSEDQKSNCNRRAGNNR